MDASVALPVTLQGRASQQSGDDGHGERAEPQRKRHATKDGHKVNAELATDETRIREEAESQGCWFFHASPLPSVALSIPAFIRVSPVFHPWPIFFLLFERP
jgi:hypothetical protein